MKLIEVYSTRNPVQAQLVVSILQSRGVPAMVGNAESTTMLGWPLKIRVREEHAAEGRTIVQEFLSAGTMKSDAPPWTCPGCGESIEAQFTDCWNCQTSRPADDNQEPAPPRSPPDPQIVVDVACLGCGYNLKTLPIDGKCPECAYPTFPALLGLLQVVDVPEVGSESSAAVLRPCLDWFEQRYGFPVEAIGFVQQAWHRILSLTPQRDEVSLAGAVRDVALSEFGSVQNAERVLAQWNLATTDNLVRLIEWLIELRVVSVQ